MNPVVVCHLTSYVHWLCFLFPPLGALFQAAEPRGCLSLNVLRSLTLFFVSSTGSDVSSSWTSWFLLIALFFWPSRVFARISDLHSFLCLSSTDSAARLILKIFSTYSAGSENPLSLKESLVFRIFFGISTYRSISENPLSLSRNDWCSDSSWVFPLIALLLRTSRVFTRIFWGSRGVLRVYSAVHGVLRLYSATSEFAFIKCGFST